MGKNIRVRQACNSIFLLALSVCTLRIFWAKQGIHTFVGFLLLFVKFKNCFQICLGLWSLHLAWQQVIVTVHYVKKYFLLFKPASFGLHWLSPKSWGMGRREAVKGRNKEHACSPLSSPDLLWLCTVLPCSHFIIFFKVQEIWYIQSYLTQKLLHYFESCNCNFL